jgi:hypothetical protein
MTSTRQRKERFILTFGKITGVRTGNDAVSNVLSDHGLEIFPDWAIDIMVADCISSARSAIKRNNENRRIYAERLASEAA